MIKFNKVFLTVLVGFGTMVCSAQISKGTILAGASSNLGFSNYKPDGGISTTNFNLNVKGGYFVIDNLVVGLNLGLDRVDRTNYTDASATFGLFGRYYIKGKFIVGTGLGFVNNRIDNNIIVTKSSYTQFNLHGGYALFLGESIAVEPVLNILINAGDAQGVGVGLGVGFTLFLNRK
jgi:hypothetical protein